MFFKYFLHCWNRLSGAVSNLRACHTHIPQDLWLKLHRAEMPEQETT